MRKIVSLFKRDYDGTRLVYDEVVDGAEWVQAGEGEATRKFNGTCCMIREGELFKRYDRKRDKKTGEYKPAPVGWEAAEENPDENTGHWPGWLPVGDGPEDRWHRDAWGNYSTGLIVNGTYELIGPKVQGNPEKSTIHHLVMHGKNIIHDTPRDFNGLREWFKAHDIEGIVWHHPDGRMVKIKKKDFGLKREIENEKG